jgi:hypothetical protein
MKHHRRAICVDPGRDVEKGLPRLLIAKESLAQPAAAADK